MISQIITARESREWPTVSLTTTQKAQLDDLESLEEVRATYEEYLTGAELRSIDTLASQVTRARGYYNRISELRDKIDAIETSLASAERTFQPFERYDSYLNQATEDEIYNSVSEAYSHLEELETTLNTATGPVPDDMKQIIKDLRAEFQG